VAEDVDLEKYGRLISDEAFFGKRIRLYSKGFVRVGLTKNAPYEKLLGISGSVDASKKTALGRSLAFGLTMGYSYLLNPNDKRGDVYLTIVTDKKSYALHQSPPSAKAIQAMHQLVTAGEAILKSQMFSAHIQPTESHPLGDGSSEKTGSSVEGLLSRLQQLGDLHASGVVSDDEFSQLKEKIMSGQSSSFIEDNSRSANQLKPTEGIAGDQLGGFDVILETSPDSSKIRIQMIKEFRVLNPDVGLREAKLAIDNPPIVYARGISEFHAQVIANQLEEFGAEAKIEISPSAADEPIDGALSTGEVKIKNEFPRYIPSLTKDEANEALAKLMTNRAFAVYKGYNGSVSLFDNRIEVLREGLVAKMGSHKAGVRAIEFTSIVGVYQKAPTVFANGYIKFLVLGELNNQDQKLVPTDRNAILFTYQHRKEQDELFAILEQISNINLLD
jgi:ribosomal protein L7/L12